MNPQFTDEVMLSAASPHRAASGRIIDNAKDKGQGTPSVASDVSHFQDQNVPTLYFSQFCVNIWSKSE
jgi:hypothetical protein